MAQSKSGDPADLSVRRLASSDLEAVITIDGKITGRRRRGYFEKRLAAALRQPQRHVQFAVDGPSGMVGYALARILTGEYGRERRALTLEVINVDPDYRHSGAGRLLVSALEDEMRGKGIKEFQTEARWRDHDLLRFLDANGFSLAPRQILQRPVDRAHSL